MVRLALSAWHDGVTSAEMSDISLPSTNRRKAHSDPRGQWSHVRAGLHLYRG